MKVLASLKPYYYYLIGERIKTLEIRKSDLKNLPQNVLFYMSKDEKSFAKIPKKFQEKYRKHFGKVGIEFICKDVILLEFQKFKLYDTYINLEKYLKEMCLSSRQVFEYGRGKTLYGWHISNLKVSDKPRELSEFHKCNFNSMNGTEVCGNYHCKYYQDSGSYMIPPSCAKLGNKVFRPPQSFMYIEEVEQ